MSEPQKPLPTTKRIDACIATATNILGLSDYQRGRVHDLSTIARAYVTGDLVRPDIPAPAVSTPIGADPGPLPTSGEINTALNDVQSILIRPGTERVAMMHLTQLGHAYVQNEVTSTKGVAKALHAARTEVEDAEQAAANAKAALADIAKAKSRLAKKLTKVTRQRDEALKEGMVAHPEWWDTSAFEDALMDAMKTPIAEAPDENAASASGTEDEDAVGRPEPTLPATEWGAPTANAAGGWCAPSDQFYDITARRGGISFTAPDFKETKKTLRARVKNLQDSLRREQARNGKLRRRNRRLRKFIEGA